MELTYQIFRYAMGALLLAAASCFTMNAFIERQAEDGVPGLRKATIVFGVLGIVAGIGFAVLYGIREG